MPHCEYRGRKAVSLESRDCRVTLTVEGGHIAEFADLASGINPLWMPPWPSIEPSSYDPARHPEYGGNVESKLLAGILGHNLCLDVFGGPSEAEAAAGLTVHGEASVGRYSVHESDGALRLSLDMPLAGLHLERTVRLAGRTLAIEETVENMGSTDRPIAWTQHVTMGPPFIARGRTQFALPAVRSRTIEHDFTAGKGYMPIGVDFEWPRVPTLDGGTADMRTYTDRAVSGAYSAHLLDPGKEQAYFIAYAADAHLAFGYLWRQRDFPWIGIWEENCSRESPPWNGQTITCGMEFGVSPMPESRRQMIDRGSLFGVPGYRWLGARSKATVRYYAFLLPAGSMPKSAALDGEQARLDW